MAKLSKWKQEYLDNIQKYSNEEILDEVIASASGDDYDGAFTDEGLWMFKESEKELRSRLKNIGFIKE